jgi:hypothetical protein
VNGIGEVGKSSKVLPLGIAEIVGASLTGVSVNVNDRNVVWFVSAGVFPGGTARSVALTVITTVPLALATGVMIKVRFVEPRFTTNRFVLATMD